MSRSGLPDVVRALRAALEGAGAPYMVIGGLAVILHGVPRLTRDVDAAIWAQDIEVEVLLANLAEHGFVGRIPDVEAFARTSLVLLLRHEASGTPVDLSLACIPFEHAALERAAEMDVDGEPISVATVGDIIVYKSIAWRRRDQDDIEQLAMRHRDDLDVEQILLYVAEFADALEEPGRVEDVRRLISGANEED